MHCQSALARVPKENNIKEATLDQFVRNPGLPIVLMKKGDTILGCMIEYLKAHPTVKTILFVIVDEILNQFKTMYNQEVPAQVFYGTDVLVQVVLIFSREMQPSSWYAGRVRHLSARFV